MSEIDDIKQRARDFLEKRRFERFRASLQIGYRIISAQEKSNYLKDGVFCPPQSVVPKASQTQDLTLVMTEDISLGGLRISSPAMLPQGSDLLVNLELPKIPIPVSALASLMWSRPSLEGGSYQNGLKFTAINNADLARVEGFLAMQKKSF
jgi:hypothetical protein